MSVSDLTLLLCVWVCVLLMVWSIPSNVLLSISPNPSIHLKGPYDAKIEA